jgi:hypothetical protein
VSGPFGHLGRRHARIQPERDSDVPEVVGNPRQGRTLLSLAEAFFRAARQTLVYVLFGIG